MFKAPYRRREEQAARRETPSGAAPRLPPVLRRPPSPRIALWPLRLRWTVGLTLAVLSFWLNLFWAAAIRPLNAPDEPAYLQTVMQVRNERLLPEIHFDFGANPQGVVVGTPGSEDVRTYTQQLGLGNPVVSIAYQSVQPPLYFLLTAPLTLLVPATPAPVLYLSRLVSALFGAGVVYFAWAATRELAPGAPLWAGAVGGAIALLPEFCFNNARVANDSLVLCAGAAMFYVTFRGLRQPGYDRWMMRAGVLFGLALLSKLTAVELLPGLALAVCFRAWQDTQPGQWRVRLLRGLRLALGATASTSVVAGWWFVRNIIAYGEPTGTQAANQFWRLNLLGLDWNNAAARTDFIQSSWYSFWGFFGWQNILMPDDFYQQALWLSVLLVGLSALAAIWTVVRWIGRRQAPAHVWQAGVIMVVTTVTALYSFVQFSLTVAEQAQGRYLYLLLLPAALLFTGGLYAWSPGRWARTLALSLPLLWLAGWNVAGLLLVR